jgi:uncharacterized membrane protein YkoI
MRVIVALAVVVLALPAMWAEDEKIALDKLPKAIKEAVKAKFPGATLVKASKENEDGKTIYEVNLKYKGHTLDVSLSPDGKILEIEKTIAAKDLPKAVTAALEAKYPKATIKKAEEISKGEKVSAYEVLLVTAGKKTMEVVIDPSGKITKTGTKGEKKQEKDKKD